MTGPKAALAWRETLPQGGDPRRGRIAPGQPESWLPVREEAYCSQCHRRLAYWRDLAGPSPGSAVRCGPDDLERCKRLARNNKNSKINLRRQQDAQRRALAESQAQAAAAAAAQAEAQERERRRVAACPRPDKSAWSTLEGAETAVAVMRAKKAPRSRDLHGYLCSCGAFHIGDRTLLPGDRVFARWGSQEPDQDSDDDGADLDDGADEALTTRGARRKRNQQDKAARNIGRRMWASATSRRPRPVRDDRSP